jgi:hypothetical protein
MLHEFVTVYREEIIRRCRAKVETRSAPPPTKGGIDHGVPMFLDELVDELRLGLSPNPKISKTATQHGLDLLRQGFTAAQVVNGYGDVCQAITELGLELDAPISTDDFRMLNRCLDDAIAAAITEYGRERDQAIHGETADETEHLGVLAREVRKSIRTASVALEVIWSGSVGIAGNTGAVLQRSLVDADELINRLLAQVYAARRTTDAVTKGI